MQAVHSGLCEGDFDVQNPGSNPVASAPFFGELCEGNLTGSCRWRGIESGMNYQLKIIIDDYDDDDVDRKPGARWMNDFTDARNALV